LCNVLTARSAYSTTNTPPSTTTVDTNVEPKQPDGVDGPAGGAPNNRGEADGSLTNNNNNGIDENLGL
jgi:hypothetical protein